MEEFIQQVCSAPNREILKNHIINKIKSHDIFYDNNRDDHDYYHQELVSYVKGLTTNVLEQTKITNTSVEVDIYIPDAKLAIDYNNLFRHSDLQGKHKKYHLERSQACEREGIRLIHVFENEWVLKGDIVKSRIRSFIGINERIYARKCKVVPLTSKEFTKFFNESHIQGSASASICYGLMYKDELVAALSLGKSRFKKDVEYELIRYANKANTNVLGGAGRLFKHFIKNHNPASIISYSDKRWNTGNLYKQLGFEYSHLADPNYFYFHPSNHLVLQSRQTYQKHKLPAKLTTFDPLLTEWENMVNNGYNRIWDCGNSVWVWTAPV